MIDPFVIRAQQHQQVAIRLRPHLTPERKGAVGSEIDGTGPVPLRQRKARPVAHVKMKVGMPIDQRREPRDAFRRPEVDRLWQLHDAAVPHLRQHVFAEQLMMRPDIAQIAAAVQEQHALRACCTKRRHVEPVPGRDVIRFAPGRGAQHLRLAEPDRAVADVRVIGKVDQRIPVAGADVATI